MKQYRMLIWILVPAVLGVVAWSALPARTPSQRGDRDTRRELEGLRARIDELSVRQGHLAQAAAVPAPVASPAPPGEPRERAQGEDSPRPAQRTPDSRELVVQIDGTFATEPEDPAWSTDAVRQLGDAVRRTLPPGTTLGAMSCHTSLCRVESFHTSLESFREYVEASYLSHDRTIWNGAFTSLVTEQTAAGVKAVSFVAREGRVIPTSDSI